MMDTGKPWLVDDALWALVEPLLPVRPRRASREAAAGRPTGAARNPVRSAHRDRLAASPARAWVRQGDDGLASPANHNDVTQLLPLIEAIAHVPGRIGRPRHRPARLIADRGYDHDLYRRQLTERGIKPLIARRRTEHGSGLGRERWTVERTISHLHTNAAFCSEPTASTKRMKHY
jgi:transposase